LGEVLLDLAETGELAVVLGLQGLSPSERLRGTKDVAGVLLIGCQLILETLLP
jgi:hypothetical protein